jgi:hypothetical protein
VVYEAEELVDTGNKILNTYMHTRIYIQTPPLGALSDFHEFDEFFI